MGAAVTLATTSVVCLFGWALGHLTHPLGSLNAARTTCRKLHNGGNLMQSDLFLHTQSSNIPPFGSGSLPVSFLVSVLPHGLALVAECFPIPDQVGIGLLPLYLCVLWEWGTSYSFYHVADLKIPLLPNPRICGALHVFWTDDKGYQSLSACSLSGRSAITKLSASLRLGSSP